MLIVQCICPLFLVCRICNLRNVALLGLDRYQASRVFGAQVFLVVGLLNSKALVPGGDKGVLLKLNSPSIIA